MLFVTGTPSWPFFPTKGDFATFMNTSWICWEVLSENFLLTCSKLAKKLEFICGYFKIGQNFDIYFDTIASISLLGIYNCYNRSCICWEERDMNRVFWLLCELTCSKLAKNPGIFYVVISKLVKILIFIWIRLLLFHS